MTTMTTTTTTRIRQRLGGDMPYRDDPTTTTPSSSGLQSYTVGGYGPVTTDPHDFSKSKRQLKRPFWSSLCCGCCNKTTTSSTADPTDSYYYMDHFNDLSWNCSMGTSDDDGIWYNRNDPAGTIMSFLVWFLISYSSLTVTWLAQSHSIPTLVYVPYIVLSSLALATHAKTTLTDPGAVPPSAVPTERQRATHSKLSMCSQCQTFKPPKSHHCRICNRCISSMDHHCPWMNNCVGAGNLKHFCLFLIYTWTSSAYLLLLLGHNYFFCTDASCMFHLVLTQLVRVLTVLALGAFLFTSSMLMNVIYGIMTGVGTIDRLKKKANGTMAESDEESIPLVHIFGMGPYWTWAFPIDPIFPDYDLVMGYTTPQRLLREQMREGYEQASSVVGSSKDSYNYYYNNNSHPHPHSTTMPPPPV